jgi:hypothetical protein
MKSTKQSEFTKMPGFDILEKLPESQSLKSYNKEYYNSLGGIKVVNYPVENNNKLFYHFEHNENASVSTSIGQFLVINNL